METKLGLYTGMVIRDATRDKDILNYCLSFPYEYYSYEGIPRYLIRGFMEDLLPRCILYPIIKTGRQSTDWIYRLKQSENEIFSSIDEEIESNNVRKFINREAITEFDKARYALSKENEHDYLLLFMVHVFMMFMRKYDLQ